MVLCASSGACDGGLNRMSRGRWSAARQVSPLLLLLVSSWQLSCSNERSAPTDDPRSSDAALTADSSIAVDAALVDAPPPGDVAAGHCKPMEINAWRGDPPTPDCMTNPPSGYYYSAGGCVRFTPGLCCSGKECGVMYADRQACIRARIGCSVQCAATFFFNERICRAAPDVGFCIRNFQVDAAKTSVPELRCKTSLPRCDSGSTSCRYSLPSAFAGSCDSPSILAYNSAICSLAPYATRIESIPAN